VRNESSCTFCAIARRELDSYIVCEDAHSLAFLDYRPLFPGHCLLVPKKHYETLLDVPLNEVGGLFENAQLLAGAVERALQADGSFVAVNNKVSQSVPHLHIHVVPRRKGDGLKGFFWPRHPYKSAAEMQAVQAAIRAAIPS
jgi:histidine triad (HIT) family protein